MMIVAERKINNTSYVKKDKLSKKKVQLSTYNHCVQVCSASPAPTSRAEESLARSMLSLGHFSTTPHSPAHSHHSRVPCVPHPLPPQSCQCANMLLSSSSEQTKPYSNLTSSLILPSSPVLFSKN